MFDTASAAEWARRQVFVNGRYVDLDDATGEIRGEHKHTPFIKSWPAEQPDDAPIKPDPDHSDIEWKDGKWFMKGRRVYTLAERREVVRLYHEDLMRPARIAEKTGIPRETIRSWVRRAGAFR
jgi:hypothetical protein